MSDEKQTTSQTIFGLGGVYCAQRVDALPDDQVLDIDDVAKWTVDHVPNHVDLTTGQSTAFLEWGNHPEVRAWRKKGRQLYDRLRVEGAISDAGSPWEGV